MIALKLAETDSMRDLARFWDEHDITDFDDLLEEVSEPIFRRTVIRIHLEQDENEIFGKNGSSKRSEKQRFDP